MDTAIGETFQEDQNLHHGESKRDDQEECHVLIEALSSASKVAENKSFNHSVCTGNHPEASKLRMELQRRWNDLVSDTTSDQDRRERSEVDKDDFLPSSERTASWFEKLYALHTEQGRHYHTVVHLWEMFELLDIVIDKLNVSRWYVPMAWSVFFHDSIYDPKSNRNEKDSADLFRRFVDDCMVNVTDKKTVDSALTMILATEKHKIILPGESSRDISEEDKMENIMMQKHFLDIDMAVLGKKRDAYMKYAGLIRKEYEFVPHDVYCSKRAEILESFLGDKSSISDNGSSTNNTQEKKTIYLTMSFRGAFEDRARENLRNEIRLLRNNTIPE